MISTREAKRIILRDKFLVQYDGPEAYRPEASCAISRGNEQRLSPVRR